MDVVYENLNKTGAWGFTNPIQATDKETGVSARGDDQAAALQALVDKLFA